MPDQSFMHPFAIIDAQDGRKVLGFEGLDLPGMFIGAASAGQFSIS
ncbi:hypothetical Protein YC6258_02982 [Gynuella sunshinyii YC6258]|uniref:Uncharacterized protein n=1 Tax=Gynuella sunshinyii YC6258 TaxID=1445510 RepID=A0A0C5V6D4_9GAMM|nr:hypothetical Protein YC6258_02982 [Gynuella sunshinyii YC6258]